MAFQAFSFVPGATVPAPGNDIEFRRPQDNAVIGRIGEGGADGVAAAVASSRKAFVAHRKTPMAVRIGWLKAAAVALRDAAEEIAALISEDVGKPIRMARFEVNRGVDFIEACVAAVPQLKGEVLALDAVAAGAGLTGITRRVPYGV